MSPFKGAGQDKTILSFAGQTAAGEGLLVTSDGVTLTGFTMLDSKGDGIKSKGADHITLQGPESRLDAAGPRPRTAPMASIRWNPPTC